MADKRTKTYIIDNIGKVNRIVIKAAEEVEGRISVGFSVYPPDAEEYGVGETLLFIEFDKTTDDAQLVSYIAMALEAGVQVGTEGVASLMNSFKS